MRRRDFVALLGGGAVLPLATRAEQAPAIVMGLLTSTNLSDWALSAVREGLEAAGYVEGRNIVITMRSADNHFDRLPGLTSDLVKSQVALIFATGSPVPARLAKAATSTIPIVFAYGGDPVADGLVESLNRPGGNVTGATFIGSILLAKRIELLRQLAPNITDVALLINPRGGPLAERQAREGPIAAQALGLHLHIFNASTLNDLEVAFATMNEQKVGGFITSTDPFFGLIAHDGLLELASHYKLPGVYNARVEMIGGGLASYGPVLSDTWRQAGIYAGRILKGEKPSNLPVMQPTRFETVIDLKTAKALGLAIPPAILSLADEVIE